MKPYLVLLVVGVGAAIAGVLTQLWFVVGVGVLIGVAGFVTFVRTGQGTHPPRSPI